MPITIGLLASAAAATACARAIPTLAIAIRAPPTAMIVPILRPTNELTALSLFMNLPPVFLPTLAPHLRAVSETTECHPPNERPHFPHPSRIVSPAAGFYIEQTYCAESGFTRPPSLRVERAHGPVKFPY